MTAAAATDYDYWRVHITARLRTLSPLHCGDGGTLPASAWPSVTPPGAEGHINTLCQAEHCAYIPASTLRGSLLDRCAKPEHLFGSARGDGKAGRVRVYDAFLSPPAKPPQGDGHYVAERGTTVRNGVSLDPVTGTAAQGRLFAFEIVPEHSTAALVIEADCITRSQLVELLGLLRGWNGSAASAIGRGRSRGWGKIQLEDDLSVQVLTTEALRGWVKGPGDSPPLLQPVAALPDATGATPPAVRHLTLRLSPQAPTLVNQPGRVKPRERGSLVPALEFMRAADGTAIIPGSTLRGALRARAARILRTLALAASASSVAQDLDKLIERLLNALLGTERSRSPLWLDEAKAEQQRPRKQHFNAVDRFTAGVAGGALYAANAVDCDHFETRITLEQSRTPDGDWWRALLLYLARDLIEGDIGVGWGKSRGYGTLLGEIVLEDGTELGDFAALLAAVRARFGETTPEQWANALEQKISALVEPRR